MKRSLTFRSDGTFKIVQFTDIHWKNGDAPDQLSRKLMESVIEEERPDLVVFTGDLIESKYSEDPIRAFRQAVETVENSQVPWAYVFGNHDAEAGVTREELMALQQEYPMCLSTPGPTELSGVGNYILPVYDARRTTAKATLYFLDSHQYAPAGYGKYDWIKRDQIDWYARNAAAIAAKHGRILPALAFFHIPLPEYKEVLRKGVIHGSSGEKICSPKLNSGMLHAFVERGDVMATFVGHDHLNDFYGDRHGIRLVYGRVSGYNTYPDEPVFRGARVIILTEDQREFDTWVHQADGTIDRFDPATNQSQS